MAQYLLLCSMRLGWRGQERVLFDMFDDWNRHNYYPDSSLNEENCHRLR